MTTRNDEIAEYLAAKDRTERLVEKYGALIREGSLTPRLWRLIDQAWAEIDRLKEAAGEGGPDDPLCCQRYSRLHHPVFSVTGCRWYELRPQTAPSVIP
jgi:hypothetical protein